MGRFLDVAVPGVVGLASISSIIQIVSNRFKEQAGDTGPSIIPTPEEVRSAARIDPEFSDKNFWSK